MDEEQAAPRPLTREEEIARKAARLVKASKPQLKRAVELGRPRAEAAGHEAARYVREHESEIKDAALRLARARLGPLGAVVEALTGNAANRPSPSPVGCLGCGTENPPSANFCSECGQRLAVTEEH
jgi:hypothetical protein